MATWIIDMYRYFVSQPKLIIHGFEAAGIADILKQ